MKQPNKKHKPLTKVGELNESTLKDETPRELDWCGQLIPWAYILAWSMYMLVLNLSIQSRVDIAGMRDMMQPHGSGRMEGEA